MREFSCSFTFIFRKMNSNNVNRRGLVVANWKYTNEIQKNPESIPQLGSRDYQHPIKLISNHQYQLGSPSSQTTTFPIDNGSSEKLYGPPECA